MATKIFVNLPVADLKKSMGFYTAIGLTNNPQFTDETAACMEISDDIFVECGPIAGFLAVDHNVRGSVEAVAEGVAGG